MPSESQTRKEIIDIRLMAAGWAVSNPTQVPQEFSLLAAQREVSGQLTLLREAPVTYGSREVSDYVLLAKNGRPIAVIEAKKSGSSGSSVGPGSSKMSDEDRLLGRLSC